MLKNEHRLKFKRKRSNLNSSYIEDASLKIANKILEVPIWNFSFYHTFLSINTLKEVDTSFLITVLQGKDKNIIIPRTVSSTELKHYLLTDSTRLRLNKLNIPEPIDGIEIKEDKIDVVFIPLLAYDKKGNRVGYGKGYYDIFLAQCKPEVVKIGLSFFEPENEIKDINYNDISLDYCVTPNNIYRF